MYTHSSTRTLPPDLAAPENLWLDEACLDCSACRVGLLAVKAWGGGNEEIAAAVAAAAAPSCPTADALESKVRLVGMGGWEALNVASGLWMSCREPWSSCKMMYKDGRAFSLSPSHTHTHTRTHTHTHTYTHSQSQKL